MVGTPIGNLEDITLRALRVLREVGLIAAEDTRSTLKLLAAHDIHTPLTSYYGFSRPHEIERVLTALHDRDVAVVRRTAGRARAGVIGWRQYRTVPSCFVVEVIEWREG